jgi:hypothetical protein
VGVVVVLVVGEVGQLPQWAVVGPPPLPGVAVVVLQWPREVAQNAPETLVEVLGVVE